MDKDDLDILKVYQFEKKVRLGTDSDGGYVIADLGNERYDCYISAGIGTEESFTKHFIDRYDMNEYNSFGFDGTINGFPYQYTKNISFIKKNINSFNDNDNTNLDFLIRTYNNIFLKMDIETGEYPWLLSLEENQLKKFKQIVMEVHWTCSDERVKYTEKIEALKKLNKNHYLVHVHGNNYAWTVKKIPYVVELTYVNKEYFSEPPKLNTIQLPTPGLDMPNNRYAPDFDLNFYPFVSGKNEKKLIPTISKDVLIILSKNFDRDFVIFNEPLSEEQTHFLRNNTDIHKCLEFVVKIPGKYIPGIHEPLNGTDVERLFFISR